MNCCRTRSVLVVAVLMAVGLAGHADAGIIFDSFTLASPDRDAGDPLNGTTTEVGGQTWSANGGLLFAGDVTNGVVENTVNLTRSGLVPIVGGDPVLTTSIDMTFPTTDGSTSWGIYVGLVDVNNHPSSEGVALQVRKSGLWLLKYNNVNLLQGNVSGFNPASFTHVVLSYDRTDNTVDGVINGQAVFTNHTLASPLTVNYAGFTIDPNNVGNQVDNFLVLVPEPASAIALGVVLVPMLAMRRRRGATSCDR